MNSMITVYVYVASVKIVGNSPGRALHRPPRPDVACTDSEFDQIRSCLVLTPDTAKSCNTSSCSKSCNAIEIIVVEESILLLRSAACDSSSLLRSAA